jgi:hypothetical protein
MKKKIYSFLTIVLCSSIWLMAQPENVAVDGGFEDATLGGTSAPNWTLGGSNGTVTFTVIDSVVHSGTKAMQVVVVGRSGGNPWDDQLVNENVLIQQSTYYRFSVWAKANSNTPKVNLTVGICYSPYSELTRIGDQALTTKWTRYNIVLYNEDHDTVRTPIHLLDNGIYYFDDMEFTASCLKSAQVDPTGNFISVKFGWPITTTSFVLNSFFVSVNGNGDAATSIVKDGTSGVKIALTDRIMPGDSVTIGYISGAQTIDYSGGPTASVEDFMDEYVENLSDGSSGIRSFADNSAIRISPNPVSDVINLQNIKNSSSIRITNLLGQNVITINRLSGSSINVASLDKGVYYLIINNQDGTSGSLKFIKQ